MQEPSSNCLTAQSPSSAGTLSIYLLEENGRGPSIVLSAAEAIRMALAKCRSAPSRRLLLRRHSSTMLRYNGTSKEQSKLYVHI